MWWLGASGEAGRGRAGSGGDILDGFCLGPVVKKAFERHKPPHCGRRCSLVTRLGPTGTSTEPPRSQCVGFMADTAT